MSEDLHPIDDLFRSGLNGKEETPTPAVWNAIERELDKKDRKPIGGFFRLSGRAAAVALIIVTGAALFAAGYFIRAAQEEEGIGQGAVGTEQNEGSRQGTVGTEEERQEKTSTKESISPGSVPTGEGSANKATSSPLGSSKTASTPGETVVPGKTIVVKSVKPGPLPLNKPAGASSETFNSSTDVPTHTGMMENTITWEMATALPSVDEHPLPEPAGRIPANEAVIKVSKSNKFPHASAPQTTPANIPVANKKAEGLQVPKFSITPYVAFQNHSVHLKDDGSHWGSYMRKDMERTEQLPGKISGGILADFRIAKHFSIQSGLGLTQLDVTIQPKQIKAEKDIDGRVKYRLDCSAGTYFINPKQGVYPRPGDTITTQMATNSLQYLNIPLNLRYHFGNNKLQFFATAGTGINILTGQNLNAMVSHQYQYYGGRTTNLRSSYFNGMIGGGATYFVTKRVGIYVSPQYNFAISSMNEGLPVKSLPRTFNMQTGVTIKL